MGRLPRDLRRGVASHRLGRRHDRRLKRRPVGESSDSGAGLVSAIAGVLVFLAFLLLAAQVLVHLYASSFVTAAAFDTARLASAADAVTPSEARAHGLALLGGYARHVTSISVGGDGDTVTVRIQADSPALLPRAMGAAAGVTSIDRSATLRREQEACPGC